AARPADVGRPTPEAVELPPAGGPGAVSLAGPGTGSASLSDQDSGIIAAGTPAPEFTLRRGDGSEFTREDLLGGTTVLVFYPFAFSPVCTDQLNLYEEVLDEFRGRGATLYGVSCDATYSQTAFAEKVG